MDIATILLIALGLAMDAFAVSIATGITTSTNRRKNALLMASFFGVFQMLMTVIGWSVGLTFQGIIEGIDHWIAFALLAAIGGKMIYDSFKKEDKPKNNLRLSALLLLALATSIDALMVGLSFAFLQSSIIVPVIAIGAVTFSLSFAGFIFGCAIGQIFEKRVRVLGGLILIAIGLKILLDALLV
jgi:putative Mn2+ efflux pump MntP